MHTSWIIPSFEVGLVSVIIPTYNRVVLLEEALQSVINQTYRPVECIVVDDGSTDHTNKLVKKYIELNNESFTTKYIYQKNSGSQIARNAGTLLSSGEFIQYLDSDDILYPDKISKQVQFLKANTICDGVFGNWRTGNQLKNEMVTAYESEDMIDQMLTGRCIHTLSFLMRRSLVEKIGPWDITLKRNQEIDYHLMGLLTGAKYCYFDHETGLHRKHSLTTITASTGLKEIHQFYVKWEKLLKENKRFPDEMKIKFANMYLWIFGTHTQTNSATVDLLADVMRLHPNATIFSSKKLTAARKLFGTRLALRLWLSWLIYNKNKPATKVEQTRR